MQLAKALLEDGVLLGSSLEGENRTALESLLDSTPTRDRREGHELTIALNAGTFYIYDFDGYLCSTLSIEALVILLMLSERKGTRATLFPDQGPSNPATVSELDSNFAQLQARAKVMAQAMAEKRAAGPRGTPGQGDESGIVESDGQVRIIGLGDGEPKF